MMPSDKDLIDDLGGSAELARRLGYSVQRVENWKKRGIPAQVRLDNPDVFPLPSRAKEAAHPESQPQ
jgi:hypothetical protein